MMRWAALLLLVLPVAAQEKGPREDQVEKAVAAGVTWLKRAQEGDGSWGPCWSERGYEGSTRRTLQFQSGPTLLALYTLAVCGEKKKSPSMREGYAWVRNHYRKTQVWTPGGASTEMGTFEAAALLLALPVIHEGPHPPVRKGGKTGFKLPHGSRIPKDDWLWMHEAVVFLTQGKRDSRAGFRGCQTARGGWGYGAATIRTVEEMPATHFVLLGLRSATRAGYPVPSKVWYGATAFLKEMQSFKGGFGYREAGKGTAGMTAAGIVSWLICKEQLDLARKRIPPEINTLLPEKWMRLDRVYVPGSNPGPHPVRPYHFYALWTVGQAATLGERPYVGGKDWYAAGARYLLGKQEADGHWTDATCIEPQDRLGTCFALLFLKKSTPKLYLRR
ncbi:MAG: prenyltransferase/squalene oxidase repeat-containing protein [Planctomycetota bacterium]|jgi:hypothetical protein